MDDTQDLNITPNDGGTHAIVVAAAQREIRLLLAYTLEGERYRLHEETTVRDVVVQTQISRPRIVVLDSHLAGGDGIEACRQIKSNPRTRDTAVIVISGRVEPEERRRALEAGADVFLPKPFSPTKLLEVVASLCGRRTAPSQQPHAPERRAG